MRRASVLFFLFLIVQSLAFGQQATPGSEQRKSELLALPATQWDAYYQKNKSELPDSVVDAWRVQAVALYGAEDYEGAHKLVDICIRFTSLSGNTDLNGRCLLVKAEIFYFQKEYGTAIEYAQQAGKQFVQSKNTFQLARSKNRMGVSYQAVADQKNCLAAFEEAIKLKKEIFAKEPKSYGETLYASLEALGNAFYEFDRMDEALPVYQEALDLARKIAHSAGEGPMQYNLGLVYYKKNNFPLSIKNFEGALQTYQSMGDSANVLNTYRQLIWRHDQVKDTVGAKALAAKALVVALAMSDLNEALSFMNIFVTKYGDESNNDQLIPFYDAQIKFYQPLSKDSVLVVKKKLAYAYEGVKSYDKAIALYQQLHDVYLPKGDHAMCASLNKSIGRVYEEGLLNYKKADQYYQLAIDQYKKTSNKYALANAYWSQGYNRGENQKDMLGGIAVYKQAIPLFAETQDTTNWRTILCNIAISYRVKEDSVNAYKYIQQAIDLTLKNSDPANLLYVYDKAADTYGHFNNRRKKIEFLVKKYELNKGKDTDAESGAAAFTIAKAYEELGDLTSGGQYYRYSIEHYKQTTDRSALGNAYWSYGYNQSQAAYAKNPTHTDYKEALEGYHLAIPPYRDLQDTASWRSLLCNIAILHRNEGDSVKSYNFHQQAIDLSLKSSDPDNLNYAYDKAAETAGTFKHYQKQINYLQKKFDFCQKKKLYIASGLAAQAMGKVYEESRLDFTNAEKSYNFSVTEFKKTGEPGRVAEAYWNLAYNADENQKKYKDAIAYYELAIAGYAQMKDTTNWKTVLCNTAITYRHNGDSVNAYKFHQQAIDLTLNNSDPENLAYAYEKAATAAGKFNNPTRKLLYLQKEFDYASKKKKYALSGEAAKGIAKVYEESWKNYPTASKYYQISVGEYKKTNDLSGLATVYWDLAYNLDENLKRDKEAIEPYTKAIELYVQLKDTTKEKTVLSNMALTYKELKDSVNAYKTHQRAIDLTLKNSDPANLAYAYEKAAVSYGAFKNFGKKLELLNKALVMREKAADPVALSEGFKLIGKTYEEDRQEYKIADGYYLKSIDAANKSKDLNAQGMAYWNHAYNLGKMERYNEAIQGYEKSFKLFLLNKDTSNASIMRSNVGQNQWSLENFDKAIEAHKEAIQLATKGKNQEMIYKSWNALADLYKATGNPVSSTESLANAITALEVLKDSIKLGSSYSSIASSFSKSKDYTKSFAYYTKAVAIRKILKDTTSWASDLYDWGLVYFDKKEYKLATAKLKESLVLYKKTKDKSGQVYCLIWLGLTEQSDANDYKRVEQLYNEATVLAKAENNESLLAFCYDQMKRLYRTTGRNALADETSEKSLTIYRKLGQAKNVATTLSSMGYDAYYVSGNMIKAAAYYDEAEAIADTLSDKMVMAAILDGRGNLYGEQGEFTKSLEMIDKSYALYKAVDNEWGIAGTYIDRGNVYKDISEYELSMRYQSKADSMYLKLGTEYARLAPLANIGGTYVAMGDYPKALEYSLKSYTIMKNAGDLDANVCIIKGNIGEIYDNMNNYAEADKWLNEALANAKQIQAKRVMFDILGSLGRLKIEEKKYPEAERYLNEGAALSKEIGTRVAILGNQLLMGKLRVEQKQYEKAKPALTEAYEIAKSIGVDNSLWEVEYLLGVLYKNTNDLPKSKEYLTESVKLIEKIRNKVTGGEEAQKLFSSDKNILRVYDALVEVLLAMGETEEAMTYIQKNNDENLKAKFKSLDVKFENVNKKRAVEEERNMKAKLDGIEQQISKEKALAAGSQNLDKLKSLEGVKTIAESEYLKFVNQQINVQPELSKFFNNTVQPTQFRKIKSKIPKDMALVSYLAGEHQLYIFAATSDTVVAKIVTVPREQLTKDINAMLNIILHNLGTFSPGDSKNEVAERNELINVQKQTDPMIKPFEDAYHYLIAPVAKEISGKSKLAIIPTGALNYIPFQMLGKTLANGQFSLMMNQFAIFYANSTDMLFRDESEIDKKYNILAFGNPDLSLPSTEKEVNDIKAMYPNASVFVRTEATEDKAKFASENYNVMHFATHGNLDYEDFSKSYITMAGNASKSEDGRLTLEELWGMEVMTHLNIVVLSACQTAVTKGSNESSAVSPASGFLQNGVKSVVASLWKVDDEATSFLMSGFYKNIKTMNPIDALRSAQVALAKTPKFSHPYYWAGFILLGDWR